MFTSYRTNAHEIANTNPIETVDDYNNKVNEFTNKSDKFHGFGRDEIDHPIKYFSNINGIQNTQTDWTPKEAGAVLKEIYCGPIGFEYMHIPEKEMKQWIREKIERIPQIRKTKAEKLELLDRVLESQTFTNFCETKFPSAKRFGIDGLDSVISGLEHMVDVAKDDGVKNVILGMAHRGRLNT